MTRRPPVAGRWSHLVLVLAAVLLVASCSSPAQPRPAARRTARPASGLAAFYRQRLHWSGCGAGFQCAWLSVPLDYARPGGRRLRIAVIRLPAASPRDRIGSLLVNPGGPGASGVAYARAAREIFPVAIRDRFDIVGFDPRGAGASAPVRCLTNHQLDEYVALDEVPDAPGELAALERFDRLFAAECSRHSGWLLPHVSTLDTARDMDVLRAALRDARLTYLGKSYGTYLGAKYAQLFPRHVRALVLDGAVDPTVATLPFDQIQAVGFEADLRDYLHWCVGRLSCPLGSTYHAARAALGGLIRRVDDHPELVPGGRRLGAGEFYFGLAAGLYDPTFGWPDLNAALGAAAQGDGSVMLQLTDQYTDRSPSGSYDNLMEASNAIWCVDRPSPRSVASYAAAARASARTAPVFGPANVWSSLLCAYWPAPPVERPGPVHAVGAPPILVVGTTRDPATPYVWAQHLAHQLRSGRLLTFDGDGHTAYGRGSACIDRAVDAYLLRLQLPRQGLVCH